MASRLDFSQIRSLYIGTSPSTTVDTNNLIVSGNVGIGTTSPVEKLDVRGGAYINGGTNNNTYDATLYVTAASSSDWGIFVSKPSHDYGIISHVINSASYGFSVYDGTTHNFVVKGNGTTLIQGNVGIGTTNPGKRLVVTTASNDEWIATFTNTGTTPYGVYIDTSTNSGTTFSFATYTNAGTGFFVRNDGKVGIGTSSPASKLTIVPPIASDQSTIEFTNSDNAVVSSYYSLTFAVNNSNTQAGRTINFSSGGKGYGNQVSTMMVIQADSGNVGIGTTSPSNRLTVYQGGGVRVTGITSGDWIEMSGNLPGYSDNQYPVIKSNGTIHFANNNKYSAYLEGANTYLGILDSTTTTRIFLTTSGNSYLTGGNVGINTTSPEYKLHVRQDGITAAAISTGWPSFTAESAAQSKIALYLDTAGNGNIGTAGYGASVVTQIGQYYDSRGVITMIGAGGASPSDQGTGYGKDLMVKAGNSDNNNGLVGGRLFLAGGSGFNSGFNTNYGSVVLQPQGGNVGIGTTAPGDKLHVKVGSVGGIRIEATDEPTLYLNTTDGLANAVLFNSYGNIGIVNYAASTTNYVMYHYGGGGNAANQYTYFQTAGSERMRITGSGNVGIGSTAPAVKLRVQSSGSSFTAPDNNNVAAVSIYNSNNSSANAHAVISLRTQISGGNPFISYDVENEAGWSSGMENSSNQFRIAYGWDSLTNYPGLVLTPAVSPNVLIGTTTDNGYKLRVNGKGYFDNNVVISPQSESWAEGLSFVMPSTSTWGGLRWRRERVGNDGNWYIGFTALDATDDLVFGANNGGTQVNNIMRMTKAGLVGIGTSSPGSLLQVGNAGAAPTGLATLTLTGANTAPQIATKPGLYHRHAVGLGVFSDYAISFQVNGSSALSDAMYITNTGNVGIGTTSPTTEAKVHIVGQGTYYGLQIDSSLTNTGGSDNLFLRNTLSGNYVSIGLSANDSDGQHHRVVLKAKKDPVNAGTAAGIFQIDIRNTSSNYTTALTVNALANVGIGTTTPSYKLDVAGDARITSGSLGVGVAPNATDGRIDASNDIVAYQTSDQRLKENVTPIENALEKVKLLTGVEFDWIEEHKHIHGYEGHDTGVIAQQVQAVMPTAVRTNDSGYLSVRYEKMIALLIEGMKEQQKEIDELKKLIK